MVELCKTNWLLCEAISLHKFCVILQEYDSGGANVARVLLHRIESGRSFQKKAGHSLSALHICDKRDMPPTTIVV